jgi:hypothetical protein
VMSLNTAIRFEWGLAADLLVVSATLF